MFNFKVSKLITPYLGVTRGKEPMVNKKSFSQGHAVTHLQALVKGAVHGFLKIKTGINKLLRDIYSLINL